MRAGLRKPDKPGDNGMDLSNGMAWHGMGSQESIARRGVAWAWCMGMDLGPSSHPMCNGVVHVLVGTFIDGPYFAGLDWNAEMRDDSRARAGRAGRQSRHWAHGVRSESWGAPNPKITKTPEPSMGDP